MVRLICRQEDVSLVAALACNHGIVTHKTFDDDLRAMEEWLLSAPAYVHRAFVGIELVDKKGK